MAALSPAAPIRLLSQDALRGARAIYRELIRVNAAAVDGRQGIALDLLGGLAEFAAEQLPVVEQIIAAQQQAAEAVNLTQRTLAPFFGAKTAEHADTAQNDNHPPSPQQPGPDVA